jgi:hypothetical protein
LLRGKVPLKRLRTKMWRDDVARASGESSAAAMVDLSKAYERIQPCLIIVAAQLHSFPLRLLAVALSMYSSMRRIVVDGACSRGL